ncbi:MAG: hypothetical protein ACOVLC_02535, partial [Flavobacterium sp.]
AVMKKLESVENNSFCFEEDSNHYGQVCSFTQSFELSLNFEPSIEFETYFNDVDRAMEAAKVDVLALLKQTVRPEFINRIDEIIMFTPLNKEDISKIVGLQLKEVSKMLAAQHITMDATPEAIAFLARKGFDVQFGARPIKRLIQKEVLNKLSKEILAGKIQTDSIILIDSFEDELVFRNNA